MYSLLFFIWQDSEKICPGGKVVYGTGWKARDRWFYSKSSHIFLFLIFFLFPFLPAWQSPCKWNQEWPFICSKDTALLWFLIAGTTPKPYLRSRPTCYIHIMIRPDTNFVTSFPNSAQFDIKTQWNGITCMQLTSPKVPPSKTIHDLLLRRFWDLPCVWLFLHFLEKRAPITVIRAGFACLFRSLEAT